MEWIAWLGISIISSLITRAISQATNKPVQNLSDGITILANSIANQLFARNDPISLLLGVVVQAIGNLMKPLGQIEQQVQSQLNNSFAQIDAVGQAFAQAFLNNKDKFEKMLTELAESTFNHVSELEARQREALIDLETSLKPHIENTMIELSNGLYDIQLSLEDITHEALNEMFNQTNILSKLDEPLTNEISSLDMLFTDYLDRLETSIYAQIGRVESLVPTTIEVEKLFDEKSLDRVLAKYFTFDEAQIEEYMRVLNKVSLKMQVEMAKLSMDLIKELKAQGLIPEE